MPTQKTMLLGGAALLVAALAVFSGFSSSYLGTRLVSGLKFGIHGPDVLIAGEPAVVRWDVSTENLARYPAEKIEFCRGELFGEACTTLNDATPNDGEATVLVPSTLRSASG